MIEHDVPSKGHIRRNVLIAVIGLSVVGAVWVAGTTAANPEVAAVQAVARDTIVAEQTVGIVDGVSKDAMIPDSDGTRLAATAEGVARSHYAGPLLETRIDQFRRVVADQVGGKPNVLGGGAKDFQFVSTKVGTDTATVEVKATVWSTFVQGDQVASPTATTDYIFELQKINGQWYVTNETFKDYAV
jgi:hypothetical protein